MNRAYATRIHALKQHAQGHWTEILAALGVDPKLLTRRNQPCPRCGGNDRFQYTDKFGHGNFHCRKCGAGDGFTLLQALTGKAFHPLLVQVEQYLQRTPAEVVTVPPAASAQRMQRLVQRLWQEAQPLQTGDEAYRYLRARGVGLPVYPAVLRCHPCLGYYERDHTGTSRRIAEYPALLAWVQGADGHAVTLHRTYLQHGAKAPVAQPRKLLSSTIKGAAVRLFAATDELAVAEGLETALAVHLATGTPVWMALNAGNLEQLWLPDSVRRVRIYADNDADGDFTGQASAYTLARRLRREVSRLGPREVQVWVPQHPGTDWADRWNARLQAVETLN
ncbi:DUF7146 domain-containing protein [Pseudomonas bubulae]|uniref:DUF7146 domain-containing protein n=1 Tax=Pseudomonas bubulae TaxID=2316085 RepID=UPI002B1E106E|nr:toprim domain-containing protein [Pseudomonas bubulae]